MTPTSARTRVLIVDDAAFMRHMVRKMLESDAALEVVGIARNGVEGLEKAAALRPDVITLDIEMPEMDGLSMLRLLLQQQPLPVVMLSSLTQEGAAATLEALDLGAVDFVSKSTAGRAGEMDVIHDALLRAVHAASMARVQRRPPAAAAPPIAPRAAARARASESGRLVVIGSSTGGPSALAQVVPRLPADLGAPVVVVQHMPPHFTASLAMRLDDISALRVREARDGERLQPACAYLAPGGVHLTITANRSVRLTEDPPLHGVRPSVDQTLHSLSSNLAAQTVVAILTGMGPDGADGAVRVKEASGKIIVQDEASCVVYGMPRVTMERGVAKRATPLSRVADAIHTALQRAA